MKRAFSMAFLMALVFGSGALRAQEAAKPQQAPKKDDLTVAVTSLRVQVVFSEFDGDKKVSSLPYTFSVNADERRTRPNSQVRNGARVPISTDKDKINYLDIGTNIDCSALLQDDGRFKLTMNVERSAISTDSSGANNAPIIRQFRAEINPVLKDGQTIESIVATDPLNGHVYHVSVTVNVLK
ncbi:MAG TPA: hypothetical protein VKT53_12540 [Candidatus Acidoferrum sp.]|nr:hypothetical protein [Candidatus Acidoferrum sp.]